MNASEGQGATVKDSLTVRGVKDGLTTEAGRFVVEYFLRFTQEWETFATCDLELDAETIADEERRIRPHMAYRVRRVDGLGRSFSNF